MKKIICFSMILMILCGCMGAGGLSQEQIDKKELCGNSNFYSEKDGSGIGITQAKDGEVLITAKTGDFEVKAYIKENDAYMDITMNERRSLTHAEISDPYASFGNLDFSGVFEFLESISDLKFESKNGDTYLVKGIMDKGLSEDPFEYYVYKAKNDLIEFNVHCYVYPNESLAMLFEGAPEEVKESMFVLSDDRTVLVSDSFYDNADDEQFPYGREFTLELIKYASQEEVVSSDVDLYYNKDGQITKVEFTDVLTGHNIFEVYPDAEHIEFDIADGYIDVDENEFLEVLYELISSL